MSMLQTYENFSSDVLDTNKWFLLEVPLGEGESRRYEEPHARVTIKDSVLEVDIARFETFHDQVQMFDSGKQAYFSTKSFPLPAQGEATFSAEMAVTNHGGNPDDVRDAFASFNVVDLASGAVFDAIATSRRLYALHERLKVPGVNAESVFTHIVEAPLVGLSTEPGEFHEYMITLDRTQRRVRWSIDGSRVYTLDNLEVFPSDVQIGFGIFTLHPIRNGQSTARHGQGMQGRWRNFRYAI